jgi:hypothetical protein
MQPFFWKTGFTGLILKSGGTIKLSQSLSAKSFLLLFILCEQVREV